MNENKNEVLIEEEKEEKIIEMKQKDEQGWEEKDKKDIKRGFLYGLYNEGNQCYAIVIVQAILSIHILYKILDLENTENKAAKELVKIANKLKTATTDCTALIKIIRDKSREDGEELFKVNRQCDAPEFLRHLINNLDGDIKEQVLFKEVHKEICPGCSFERIDDFETIHITKNIPIKKHELNDVIQTLREELAEGNEIEDDTCEKCKEHNKYSKPTVSSPPNVLILQMSLWDEYNMKISPKMKYDKEFELEGKKYELSAIVIHEGGTPKSGHYICFVRDIYGFWVKVG